jgi:hypothetical protein
LNIHQFENVLIISFVLPPNSGKFCTTPFSASYKCGTGRYGCTLTRKQQQQKQEEPILQSVETHDLQEILAGIDRYLRRLGDIHPVWELSCFIRRGIIAVLQALLPCSAGEEASSKADNPTSLF